MTRYIFLILMLTLFSCHKEELIFDAIADEKFNLPAILILDGRACVFDAKTNTLKYSIHPTLLESFNPHVEFKPYVNIFFDGQELTNKSKNLLGRIDLHKPHQIIVESKEERKVFTLIFTNIPIIQLVIHDDIVNEPKTLSRMVVNYPKIDQKSDTLWTGAEHRGASSLKYDKKSLGIELLSAKNTKSPLVASLFELKPSKKWSLDAMYVDQSRSRNKVSFELWNSMQSSQEHIPVESRYVELFINNEAQGLYNLMPNYSAEFLDLKKGAVLYKGVDITPETRFEKHPSAKPVSYLWNKWEQVFPDPKVELVWDEFAALSKLITEGSDPDFKDQIMNLLDKENVIDYYLFVNLFRGSDSVAKNWFFLKRGAVAKFQILPWDMDSSWGRSTFTNEVSHSLITTNGLFRRLEETNAGQFNSLVSMRWNELRASVFSEKNLNSLFSQNFNELRSYSIEAVENQLWGSDLDFTEEEEYIAQWIQKHLVYLDSQFDN